MADENLGLRNCEYSEPLNSGFLRVTDFVRMKQAQGIASLHKLGVVHRSLRPSHIFINSEGHAVIGGFERSVILTQEQLDAKSAQSRSAWRNSVISVVDNGRSLEDESEREWEESPEMLLGWEHGVEVDWWAYGVVLGWLASGQVCIPPFICLSIQ